MSDCRMTPVQAYTQGRTCPRMLTPRSRQNHSLFMPGYSLDHRTPSNTQFAVVRRMSGDPLQGHHSKQYVLQSGHGIIGFSSHCSRCGSSNVNFCCALDNQPLLIVSHSVLAIISLGKLQRGIGRQDMELWTCSRRETADVYIISQFRPVLSQLPWSTEEAPIQSHAFPTLLTRPGIHQSTSLAGAEHRRV